MTESVWVPSSGETVLIISGAPARQGVLDPDDRPS